MSASTALRKALAETFAFYLKAHIFHWNVTGPAFPYLHSFFGDIYTDSHAAVDGLAERIRTLGEMAPASIAQLTSNTEITYTTSTLPADRMVAQLAEANSIVIKSLTAAFNEATSAKANGLADYLQSRLDTHAKWDWMLRATKVTA